MFILCHHSFCDITALFFRQMLSLYYALPKEKESDCQKFNLSVKIIPGNLVTFHGF